MSLCISVKKKGSTEQCRAKAVNGCRFCGRHAKCKTHVLWTDVNTSKLSMAVRIQSWFRGCIFRKQLRFGGPAVLSRKDLANDEELVTFEEKTKQDPRQMFSFTENGKVWWFDFDTAWKWMRENDVPTNPYTKVPFSPETKARLREIWSYRRRLRLPLPQESIEFPTRLYRRWNIICQIFEDYGFEVAGGFRRQTFAELHPNALRIMFRMIEADIKVSFHENHPLVKRLKSYCSRMITAIMKPHIYRLQSAWTILLLLTSLKDNYTMSFLVLSALWRL